MARLFLRAQALEDVREAFPWYERRSPGLGYEFLRAVRIVLTAIERNPAQFPVAIDDIRKVPLRRFPYVAYYVVLEKGTSARVRDFGR